MKKAVATKQSKPTTRLEALKSVTLKTDLPAYRPGDKVIVKTKIKEGDKFRIQNYARHRYCV